MNNPSKSLRYKYYRCAPKSQNKNYLIFFIKRREEWAEVQKRHCFKKNNLYKSSPFKIIKASSKFRIKISLKQIIMFNFMGWQFTTNQQSSVQGQSFRRNWGILYYLPMLFFLKLTALNVILSWNYKTFTKNNLDFKILYLL